jgi:4-amino-4-deoxy-L-arabinose transferase-like glycosyltransferase
MSSRRLDLLVGGLVLAGWVTVQLILLRGPRPWDPALYWDAAEDLGEAAESLFTLRIGLVLPAKLAVLLFGTSEAALYAVPLLGGLLLVAAVYGTMLLLFQDRVLAACAALVAGLNAYYLLNSSFLFPDPLATAVFTAGVFFLVLGARREQGARLRTISLTAAGALFAWTYLAREFSPIVLLPAVAAALFFLHYRWRDLAVVAGAAVVTWLLEPLYGLVLFGKPFVHIAMLVGRNEDPVAKVRLARVHQLQDQLNDPIDTFLVFPRLVISWYVGWVFLGLLGLFVLAIARVRDRRLCLFAAWFFSFWIVMAVLGLFTLPSGNWLVNISNVRYWSPIFPALVMGAFGGLLLVMPRSLPSFRGVTATHGVAVVLAALALAPGFAQYEHCAARDLWPSDPLARWHELRSWLGSPPAQNYDLIYTDGQTGQYISAYSSSTFGSRLWKGRVDGIGRAASGVPGSPSVTSLLLINKDEFRYPKALERLRTTWTPVFISGDGAMVMLAQKAVTAGPINAHDWWALPEDLSSTAAARTCKMQPLSPSR